MTGSLAEVLHGGPVNAEEVKRVRETLVFEGTRLWPMFLKFVCLLVLAAAIATYGLLGDSLAVVIGAMIVAPLMLPIMGLAFSVKWGSRAPHCHQRIKGPGAGPWQSLSRPPSLSSFLSP